MKNIISVKNLTFAYDEENILENLSFDIKEGDFLAIVGANGSGKSTFLKLILNELKASSGDIFIEEKHIDEYKTWEKIGYVPQINAATIPNFPITSLEIVTLNLYKKMGFLKFSKKFHIEKAKNALALVNMSEFAKRPINKMSGGQQQRVMIAKALINQPQILIFDEPTTGIDMESKEQLFKILYHLNKSHNITIVMVTHELEIMKDKLTKIVKMENKKIEVVKC